MAELKPCPFCGDTFPRHITKKDFGCRGADYEVLYALTCDICGCQTKFFSRLKFAIEAWNRRFTVETNIYDKEETYPNCTVQVLTNTATGDVSVGWWENNEYRKE